MNYAILQRLWAALRRRLFGDERVVYRSCGHCHGQGCKWFSLEQLASRNVEPVMVVTLRGKLAACAASVHCSRAYEGELVASQMLGRALAQRKNK